METKLCRSCGAHKSRADFYPHAKAKDGLQSHCKKCHAAINEKYRAKNWAKQLEWNRNSYKRDPQLALKRISRWRKANLAKAASYAAKARAAKLRATPAWAEQFFIEEAYDLAQRRTKATGFEWHVDHIVPLQSDLVCGLHTHQNLQVAPRSVNCSKQNRIWPDMPA